MPISKLNFQSMREIDKTSKGDSLKRDN